MYFLFTAKGYSCELFEQQEAGTQKQVEEATVLTLCVHFRFAGVVIVGELLCAVDALERHSALGVRRLLRHKHQDNAMTTTASTFYNNVVTIGAKTFKLLVVGNSRISEW